MNDWNGGGIVAIGQAGWPNSNFDGQNLYRCPSPNGNVDYVTATQDGDQTNCPFSNVGLDNQFRGWGIFQITYEGSYCVGDNTSNGTAEITICNNPSTGYGGGTGTVNVYYQSAPIPLGCYHAPDHYFVNKYWSDYYGEEVDIMSPNNNGDDVYFAAANPPTCWASQTH